MTRATSGDATASRGNVRGEQTRSRLLDAALRSFAARGFHGTGTRDIAEAAGMSPAAVYVHYRTKEELLFALSLAGHRHVLELITAAAGRRTGPDEQLREVVREYTAWHAREHTHARVVQYEMAALTPEHAEEIAGIRREIEAKVRGIIRAGVDAGRFRPTDVGMAALALLSLGIDVARWYRADGAWTPEEIGEQYGELGLRMLSAS
ncbi:TetR/AcrR family transcriptional regulator [Dactylosporangium sp. AC04546]|uniref:TetR/AcrR family transcriptional regulator n=1 Tax=Dactylosporangium sp. AC04546 TaxID=2862460 RepID=UPI001EE0E5FE|nr:TetR/AcrR family transcriptional regulator [Dactylosporangium sp. AC04546]WVK86824.1 TetR/AcrR family transcriptional regulator [Dactylosporangium sp. AC04546]